MKNKRTIQLLDEIPWDVVSELLELNSREVDIVKALFLDQKEYLIALELRISPNTVHTYVRRLYRKLGVSTRLGVVVCVFEEYVRIREGVESLSVT